MKKAGEVLLDTVCRVRVRRIKRPAQEDNTFVYIIVFSFSWTGFCDTALARLELTAMQAGFTQAFLSLLSDEIASVAVLPCATVCSHRFVFRPGSKCPYPLKL